MAINFGALAGGIGLGYDRQSRLQLAQDREARDAERDKKTGSLLDLQISSARRVEEDAARNAVDLDYVRNAGRQAWESLNPPEPAPEQPTVDDSGTPMLPEQMAPGAGLKRQPRPPKDEWGQKRDMMTAQEARMKAALERGNHEIYLSEADRRSKMRDLYRKELAQEVYRKIDSGNMDAAHDDLAEMYNAIDDGGTVKQHGIVTGEDGKKRFYADIEKGGKVTRRSYTQDEFRRMASSLASPDVIQHDISAAEAAWKRYQDERKVSAEEKKADAATKSADAASRRADTNDDVARQNADSLAGLRASQGDRNDRWAPGGAGGGAGRDPARIREARALVDEGVYETFEDAYNATRSSNRESGDRMRWIKDAMKMKDGAGRQVYKTEAEAEGAYNRLSGGGPGLRRQGTSAGATPGPAAGRAGWGAVEVRPR